MIPRTFRFDKYRFTPAQGVDRSPRIQSPRPVAEGAHAEIKREAHKKASDSQVEARDYFRGEERIPREWSQPYQKIRSLWDPREDPALMQKPLKLMVGIEDPRAGKEALLATMRLAQRYRCRMLMVKVCPEDMDPQTFDAKKDWMEALRRKVSQHLPLDYLKKHPPQIRVERNLDPVQGLMKVAHQENCSLMVVGWSEGTLSGRVMKEAPCPVLIWRQPEKPRGLKRILVPIDATPFSYHAIVQAIILCQDFGADLFLFHVFENHQDKEKKDFELGRLMQKMDWKNIKHDLVTETGDVLKTIVHFCHGQQIDMVVMGTHPLDLANGSPKKSVTGEVVQKAPCPVFVVHPQH